MEEDYLLQKNEYYEQAQKQDRTKWNNRINMMYDMLTGQDNILLLIGKAFILPMLMIRLEYTHGTWMPLLGKGDLPGNFAKCLQGPNEHPADCRNRLMRQIHCQVNSSPAGEILVRQLACENAKADCKMVMCPFKRGRHI